MVPGDDSPGPARIHIVPAPVNQCPSATADVGFSRHIVGCSHHRGRVGEPTLRNRAAARLAYGLLTRTPAIRQTANHVRWSVRKAVEVSIQVLEPTACSPRSNVVSSSDEPSE